MVDLVLTHHYCKILSLEQETQVSQKKSPHFQLTWVLTVVEVESTMSLPLSSSPSLSTINASSHLQQQFTKALSEFHSSFPTERVTPV